MVFEGDKRVYFVAETKSNTNEKDLRRDERLKIRCGEKHFALADGLRFQAVPDLQTLKQHGTSHQSGSASKLGM